MNDVRLAASAPTGGGNNERLRDLVAGAALRPAVALTLFNRGLGAQAFTDSAWQALFLSPSDARHLPLCDALLLHAQAAFGHLCTANA